MATDTVGDRVCVIGSGMLGLLAIKNLTEQGLDVTALERNTHIGGNWHVSDMKTDQTSALPGTTSNQSKYVVSVTQTELQSVEC
jgi:dimethylaniline monooxygenase (N-oxide forming)